MEYDKFFFVVREKTAYQKNKPFQAVFFAYFVCINQQTPSAFLILAIVEIAALQPGSIYVTIVHSSLLTNELYIPDAS